MKINDELTVEIEKISNLGYGIAKVDGLVVFVEKACPKDILKVKIVKVHKNCADAVILEVLKPSSDRVEPFCPMFNACGSCQMQYINYDAQLKYKKEIVEDALHSIAGIDVDVNDVVASPQQKAYRCKIQYPVGQTKVSKRILAGYYKPKSHEIINIKYCPIQPSLCDEIVEFIRIQVAEIGLKGYNELKHNGDLRHIVIRHSANFDENLVVLVVNSPQMFGKLRTLANKIMEQFNSVVGVCVNFNSKQTNVIMGKNTELVCGKEFIKEKILDKDFKIGANTFFQVNPKSAENIFGYVKSNIPQNCTVLDAYAGISAFGVVVSDVAKNVVSVESNEDSIALAKDVLALNKVDNVELICADTQLYCENLIKRKDDKKFDVTILDPPRKGASEKSLDSVLQLTKKRIIYVSCNPATLARDLKYLISKGAKIMSIQPFDMFCHTYHVETVVMLDVENV